MCERMGDGVDPCEEQLVNAETQAQNLRAEWRRVDAENQALRTRLERAEVEAKMLREAAAALVADVHRRYPGEELRCPYMRALAAALSQPSQPAPSADKCEPATDGKET